MLSINMDDVMQVVSNIQNYLIAFGVVLVLALLVMFAVRKMPKAKKKMIRAQSGLAILLALAKMQKIRIDFIISDKNRWIIYRDCSIMNTEIYFK